MSCSEDGAGPLSLKRGKILNNKSLTNEKIVNLLTVTCFSYFDSLFTCHAPAHNVAFGEKIGIQSLK